MQYQVYWNGKCERVKTLDDAINTAKFYTIAQEHESAFAVIVELGKSGYINIFYIQWVGGGHGHAVTRIFAHNINTVLRGEKCVIKSIGTEHVNGIKPLVKH